jgi:hypothetical protein
VGRNDSLIAVGNCLSASSVITATSSGCTTYPELIADIIVAGVKGMRSGVGVCRGF